MTTRQRSQTRADEAANAAFSIAADMAFNQAQVAHLDRHIHRTADGFARADAIVARLEALLKGPAS